MVQTNGFCEVSSIHPSLYVICCVASVPPWIRILPPSNNTAANALRGVGSAELDTVSVVHVRVDCVVSIAQMVEKGTRVPSDGQ